MIIIIGLALIAAGTAIYLTRDRAFSFRWSFLFRPALPQPWQKWFKAFYGLGLITMGLFMIFVQLVR